MLVPKGKATREQDEEGSLSVGAEWVLARPPPPLPLGLPAGGDRGAPAAGAGGQQAPSTTTAGPGV